jgi:hypothetical protein
VLVTRGRSTVVAVAVGLGLLAGWRVGATDGDCEHTCPARGPCPPPNDCLSHPFNWIGAAVLGTIVAVIVVAVGLAILNRAGRD